MAPPLVWAPEPAVDRLALERWHEIGGIVPPAGLDGHAVRPGRQPAALGAATRLPAVHEVERPGLGARRRP